MNEYLPVSEQLNLLFEHVLHPEGRPYTLQEVAGQINVSVAALSALRLGRIRNPQLNTLRELCRFFRVPLRYFQTCSREECFTILASDEGDETIPSINEIALRATHLSPRAQQDILTLIEWLRVAEEQGLMERLPPLSSVDELKG